MKTKKFLAIFASVILGLVVSFSAQATGVNPNIQISNFKYSAQQSDQGVDTQIEFDMSNVGSSSLSSTFNLQARDTTNNQLLKSTLYSLSSGQSAHVYLMDANNIDDLVFGDNNINIRIVSSDSAVVYISQNFNVVRKDKVATNTLSQTDSAVEWLYNGRLDIVLHDLHDANVTYSAQKEQATKDKYLNNLTKNVYNLSDTMATVINQFITYGVDTNTKDLGAGERAAVIASYKMAYSTLPLTVNDMYDVVKIASGRWPARQANDSVKNSAEQQFKKIYKRSSDINNANDNAAITIMTYGLRQQSVNRNLKSESVGIKTFKAVYGHAPSTTEEWNILQAITYSGAKR
jgi:hypothetical protein